MGFGAVEEKPLSEVYRDEFPVASRLVYLNHAAVSPLCRRAAEAMKSLADEVLQYGSLHYDRWLETYEGVRTAAARLIGASPREVALVKNTSEGISTVASGIRWRAGDRIVCFTEEFPANLLPWKRLCPKGVIVECLPEPDSLERIEEVAKGARLLAISFVQYLSGFRADLKAIGEICRRTGCFFFVDAIQGLGAFPVDVEDCHIDALAADGHKWLLGPEGCGVLYVRSNRLDEIEPVEFGWTNVAGFNDYSNADELRLRPDAGRYECGTLNTIGCYGLRASLEFLLEIGIDRIAAQVQRLGDTLAEGARGQGYEVLGSRTAGHGAGIVSIRKPGLDSRMIVRKLKDENILAAPRVGWVRISPHFYISGEEIRRTLGLLP